jgi:hypothetical protein
MNCLPEITLSVTIGDTVVILRGAGLAIHMGQCDCAHKHLMS